MLLPYFINTLQIPPFLTAGFGGYMAKNITRRGAMDFRKIYDTIPEEFERWRPRYCNELFIDLIDYSRLNSSKRALEIGPGTGQATEPILKTGCSYLAIELGEHLAEYAKNRYSSYTNLKIIHADFETHDFQEMKFDLVYSAATIQWIPERIGFPKVYNILKSGGTFAMMMTEKDNRIPNEALYDKIQEVYKKYFRPDYEYNCKLSYNNVVNYGFKDLERRDYYATRIYNADDYVSYIGTHCDHISLSEPYKSKFYAGIKKAIVEAGNKIVLHDNIRLYLTKKP